jgi:2-dehydropantoate 2-reductase
VQNGIGNEELVAEHVVRVIRGTTFPAGHVIAPGHVGWDTHGDTWIGPFEPSPAELDEVERLADALTRSGMNTVALEDARGAQWTKAIFNAATNPVGALTGLAHGEICDFEPTRRLISGLVAECKAVADALGIELDHDPEDMIDHAARVAHDHKASMTQDVLAQRLTEIDFLNGAIVAHGEEVGVATPLNRAIWALVKALEGSWT